MTGRAARLGGAAVTVRHRAALALFAVGWSVLRRAPERLVAAAFRLIADVAWWRRVPSVTRLERNLVRVLGDEAAARRVSRAGMRSYFRYWMEVFRLPSTSVSAVLSGTVTDGEQRLWDARATGRGVVLALPHMGNWETAGVWLIGRGVPFTTVAERLQPEELFERFLAFRTALGMEVLPLTGGERSPFGVLLERLRAGGVVCLLADRDLTASGLEVTFFGEPARMPGGPAALAVATGAVLLPVTLSFPGGSAWAVKFHDPIDPPPGADRRAAVAAMTQRLAAAFEREIAAFPADWHMLQRLWTADLDPGRQARR